MHINGNKGMLNGILTNWTKAACRTNTDYIQGKALGPKPKFFLVGDEPNMKDYLTKVPFSGPMNELLINAVQTLDQQYGGVTVEDLYVTYLVKTTFRPGQLTEEQVIEEWLPVAQLEYQLSGCDRVVAIGKIARMFAGHITVEPKALASLQPTWKQKIKHLWEVLTDG